MSGVVVWLPHEARADTPAVASAMLHALRAHGGQGLAWWHDAPLAVGVVALGSDATVVARHAPVVTQDGAQCTWLVGEVYASDRVPGARASTLGDAAVRRAIARALDADLDGTLRDLDGEFVVVRWHRPSRTLVVAADRLGALPLFAGETALGTVVASGVRAALAAPGVADNADPDALREAVSYGGFRIGGRTNARAVRLLSAATVLTARPGAPATTRRHWHWRDLPAVEPRTLDEAVAELSARWEVAMRTRLDGLARPAQTLSGGLDSRVILAAGAPLAPGWHALTYGVPGCDDARYAEVAAQRARVPWHFQPLYAGGDPSWLDQRLAHVQATDGLVELGDLMHAEALPWLVTHADGLVNGYIGDAVVGPTFNGIATADDVLAALPYYGGVLGEPHEVARARAQRLLDALGGAPARFALFEDKLPQSTNFAHGALMRAWLPMRRPFVARDFFDYAQGLDAAWRGERDVQAHWLRRGWPAFFRDIPNQKTGVPVGSSPARLAVARAARAGRRVLARAGVPVGARVRNFTDDATAFRAPGVRARIHALLTAPDAHHGGIFPAGAVRALLDAWERDAAAPAQVIGALVTWEHYHRTRGAHLAAARAAAPVVPQPVPAA
jgi:asparagine synthase (glutamine-hydrolysing)